jgi:hypothetical protein
MRHSALFRTLANLPRTEISLAKSPASFACAFAASQDQRLGNNYILSWTSPLHLLHVLKRQADGTPRYFYFVIQKVLAGRIASSPSHRIDLTTGVLPRKIQYPTLSSTCCEDFRHAAHQIAYRCLLGEPTRAARAAVINHRRESLKQRLLARQHHHLRTNTGSRASQSWGATKDRNLH